MKEMRPAMSSSERAVRREGSRKRALRFTGTAAAVLALTAVSKPGLAETAPVDGFSDKLVLDSGRPELPPPSADGVDFTLHGEYELRLRGASDLRLDPPVSDRSLTTLGQNYYIYHWLRMSPRLRYRDKIQLVGQIDIPRGLVAGDTTQGVGAVRDSMSEARWWDIHPRYLYLEYSSPIGVFRVGQQGAYWGMGMLANDGDHRTMFGDYNRGSLAERVLFATTPMGKGTPLYVVLAGDLIFEDNTADLLGDDLDDYEEDRIGVANEEGDSGRRTSGDRAFQGIMAVLWRKKTAEIGVYGVLRSQERDSQSIDVLTPYVEDLTVGVIDVSGKVNTPVPGSDAFLYAQGEVATIFGSTSFVRSAYVNALDPTAEREDEKVRSFGAVAKVGVVHMAGDKKNRFGRLVTEIEWGYASGDADPYDGTTKRFTMDPNHNVGLVLFDHVLAWKTARAATNASDASLVNRPSPGLQLLPSKGGVTGATYLNPRVLVRPVSWIDLKAGALIAQTTSDFVDPYHFGALGNAANYDGGDAGLHDLGLELDLGIDTRIQSGRNVVELGAEGGVLFPGHAFDDAAGNALPTQYLGAVKAGVLF